LGHQYPDEMKRDALKAAVTSEEKFNEVFNHLETALGLQATSSGTPAAKITYSQYYDKLVEAARNLDSNEELIRNPERKVKQAEISSPSADDPHKGDEPSDSNVNFQIHAAEIQEMLDAGIETGDVIKILNVMQKRER